MRIKSLIALLLFLLVITSLAHAQEATVEPTAEATIERIEPVPVGEHEDATAEAAGEHEEAAGEHEEAEGAAADDHGEATPIAGAAESGEESETPAGSALLMLLLGIGVVALVGAATMFRGGNKPQG